MRFVLALAALLFSSFAYAQQPDILEVVSITGEIDSGTAEDIARRVDEINDNAKVKAVLLVLDTPGGGVTASSAIYEDLSRLKVPVVAWCQSVCASGGVYVMMAPSVKYIGIRSETVTGSVGVIMHMMRYNRLLDFIKVDPATYRSGILKDAGNPTRAEEEAERKYLQGIVDTLAQKFYGLVAKARPKITPEGWVQLKTARILIGQEAVTLGLVDAVATRADVVAKAKALSGSKSIYTRDELKKMSFAAEAHASFKAPAVVPNAYGDVPWLIETAKEILSGESVKFAYRMPYSL